MEIKMIVLDTELLKQLAAAAKSATEELQAASELLNQITTHDDWGCKERVAINSYITGNRKKMRSLMENSRSFTGAIAEVAEKFVAEENGIISMFDRVENLLGSFLSIPVGTIVKTPEFPRIADILDQNKQTGVENGLPGADAIKPVVSSADWHGDRDTIDVVIFNSILEGMAGNE
ncbi:MAG: hypothetical protein MR308_11290 [Lachnospiraceae bacterium]|nr:hypothetical protein [Lachnospiraceae bacterium]